MAELLSRRRFLELTLLSLGTALLPGSVTRRRDPVTGIELDNDDDRLSLGEAAQLTRITGRAAAILRIDHWRPPLNETLYETWVIETLLQMQADKLLEVATLPVRPYFFESLEENQAAHLIGTSDCLITAKLSPRFLNPNSAWYNSPDWPGAAIHENVHRTLQHDLCSLTNSDQIENAANIITLETLASMANQGSGFAFRAFVWEMLDVCLGATFALAHQTNRLEEYEKLRSSIHPGILSQSHFEKLGREFSGNNYERFQIIDRYLLTPLQTIMRAHLKNNDLIEDLLITPRHIYPIGDNYNKAPHDEPRVVGLDDWTWAMSHLESMATAFANLPETSVVR